MRPDLSGLRGDDSAGCAGRRACASVQEQAYFNPSSNHAAGRERAVVDEAAKQLGALLNVDPPPSFGHPGRQNRTTSPFWVRRSSASIAASTWSRCEPSTKRLSTYFALGKAGFDVTWLDAGPGRPAAARAICKARCATTRSCVDHAHQQRDGRRAGHRWHRRDLSRARRLVSC